MSREESLNDMENEKIVNKIRRKLMKLRLQPIRVYCLHHVCAKFDESAMYTCDWMPIDEFKSKVLTMRTDEVEFVSLSNAYSKMANDKFRKAKYAVITFDDGYASLKEILPWLEEQKIPVTLFINGKYMDGKSYRKSPQEQYLMKEELFNLTSPYIEIGSHGWEHLDATKMSIDEFIESQTKNESVLRNHPKYVPFYAYTYGKHNLEYDTYLQSIGQVPVLIDGADNYNDTRYIHRRLL